jgi:probable LLM family oxidoreductase
MELGVYTFADVEPEGVSGKAVKSYQRMQDLLEEIKLAEEVGLDLFGIGEHHRPDFVVSAPAVVMAAAAAVTKKIRLASAVTVLSTDDPVRVYESFATADLISGGRAEIMVGRGSFIETYPLFGYNMNDYDLLFAEKLDLLLKINENERVTWKGKIRPALGNLGVYPRALQDKLPVWLAVGGTPASAVRAGTLGLPMAVAIIGGYPERFVPFVDLFKQTYQKSGHQNPMQLSINSLGYVADTSQQAADEYFPAYESLMNQLGKERGWNTLTRRDFDALRSPEGALVVGSPQEVTEKILYEHELFGNTRFLIQMSIGNMPHRKVMRSIELFGTVVAPAVRKALGK